MFGLGWVEVAVIVVVAVLIFGPKKIPELGNSLGKTLRGFQDGLKESEEAKDAPADKSDSDSKPG
jgi:sec-independent protein translocase protein TatA